MRLRLLVIIADPETSGICGALARAYGLAAQAQGAEVHYLDLKRMLFDPFRQVDAEQFEPELVDAQAALRWADHTLWAYPQSWGGMPAILKGFVDQVFTPGFAYQRQSGHGALLPLLQGKSADILVVVDSLPWYNRFGAMRAAVRQLKEAVLEPCGINPVRGHIFGPRRTANAARQARWLEQVAHLATTGLGLPAVESVERPPDIGPRVLRSPFDNTSPTIRELTRSPASHVQPTGNDLAG